MASYDDVSTWWSNTFDKIGTGLDRLWDNITGKTSKEIADRNYEQQQQILEYNKWLNQKQMEREDTAYQRAVKDANAAGFSSLSVGNGANSTTGTTVEAPQINDYASDSFNKGINLLNTITQFQNNITQQIISKKKAEADINKTNAEANSINAQTDLFNYKLAGEKDLFDKDYQDKLLKYEFFNNKNIFSEAGSSEKYAILNNLDSKSYSDIIQTNEFNKIGLLYGLISNLGKNMSDGKINNTEEALNKLAEILKQTQIYNNKLNIPLPFNNPFLNNTFGSFYTTKEHITKDFNNVKNHFTNTGTTTNDNGTSHKSGKLPEKKKRSGHQK